MTPVPIYSIVTIFDSGREYQSKTFTNTNKEFLEKCLLHYKNSKFKHEVRQIGLEWKD